MIAEPRWEGQASTQRGDRREGVQRAPRHDVPSIDDVVYLEPYIGNGGVELSE
jgi:hypothetical protein